jgi:hypothetical protein
MGVGKLAASLGIGLVAGFVGTVAMTASQAVEMRLRQREPSTTPAKAAEKVLHVRPDDERAEAALNNGVHLAYGTGWGAFRGLLDTAVGLRGWPAIAVHFAAIQGAAFVMLPGLKVSPPVREWGAKEIAVEVGHHAVYAIAAGLTYDALTRALIAELPHAEAAHGGLRWGAIGAGLAALALRRPETAPRLRIAWLRELPAGVQARFGGR